MINLEELNQKLPNYVIEKELGSGSFGVVYLAKKKNAFISKNVALKVFKANPQDLDHYKKLQREAKLWATIENHPNIVPIYDANIYEDYLVLESEYVSGGSLESYLSKQVNQQLPINSAIKMAIKILSGLDHLHQSNITHRDLKPANILLQGTNPKLVDFGLARIINDPNSSFTAGGTRPYMSLEAFYGERSPQIDVWSVGIILYQMLVGDWPFPEEVKNNIYLLPNFLSTKDCLIASPLIPEPLQKIIKQALERDCTKRYISANEMKEALENYQDEVLAHSITKMVADFVKQQISQSVNVFSPYQTFETSSPIQITSTNSTNYSKKKYFSKNFYYTEEHLHLALAEIHSKITNAESYVKRGNFYRYIGEPEKALACFNEAIEIDPSCADAYDDCGNVYYYDQHDVENALVNYNKAIEINPNCVAYYNNRGNVYKDKEEFDKSISDFTRAIEISPNSAMVYNNRGLSYQVKREWQKAIQDYNKTISLNPNYASAYYNRGNAYTATEDYESAIKDFGRAIELRPNYTSAYYNRALAYQHKGNLDKAILDFSQIIKMDDQYSDAYFCRGYLYKLQGEKNKAIADFRKAIEINSGDKGAKEQLLELEEN